MLSRHILRPQFQRHALRMLSNAAGKDVCRIGCASGFWGDTAVSAPQLIHKGNINYLVFDYLSEITMSLLAAAKAKDPTAGYASDFVDTAIGPYLNDIQKKGIRVVANAGGINPQSCAEALKKAATKAGVELNIAVVTGDDLMSLRSSLPANPLDMDNGSPLPPTINSMNAYLGAFPIARALDLGASIVVTGRCVDSAVVLGPLIHEFKWKTTDYDLLAAGSLAGHLIECGAQATGGIFSDYDKVPDWWNIGFPIVQCSPNGDCMVTKPSGTGGLVSRGTIGEQLVYEIGDPRAYILPDVVCDFSKVTLKEQAKDEVFVTGAKGQAPSDSYKVSATYLDGYRLTGVALVLGGNAVAKARRTGEEILTRVRGILKKLKMEDFRRTHLQIIGAEETYMEKERLAITPREASIWMAAEHTDKRALGLLAREIAPAGTGMAPGLTGMVGGRPKISPVLKLHSSLLNKKLIKVHVEMGGQSEEVMIPEGSPHSPALSSLAPGAPSSTGPASYRLGELAWTRSGDKANSCNVGVVARTEAVWPHLKAHLTADKVGQYLAKLFPNEDYQGRIERYELEGIRALNFVLKESLGGGGVTSLRPDPQGKGVGQMMIDLRLDNLPEGLSH